MNYAQCILEVFGKELEGYKGAQEDFCSKVLNPVLQRQLRGPPDSYAPPLIDYMSSKTYSKVTLANTMVFYLSVDPLDPGCIPSYCRNLIYIREARWHLLVLKKEIKIGSAQEFNWSIGNHELILDALEHDDEVEEDPEDDADPVPRLGFTEVLVILYEGLTTYFVKELLKVVRIGLSLEFLRTHRYSPTSFQPNTVKAATKKKEEQEKEGAAEAEGAEEEGEEEVGEEEDMQEDDEAARSPQASGDAKPTTSTPGPS